MITALTALQTVNAEIKAKYAIYSLRPAVSQPLELPEGWRFPYNSFVEPFRVQSKMLCLFVDRNTGQAQEEWTEFPVLETFREKLLEIRAAFQQPLNLPALEDVMDQVQTKIGPAAQLEMIEPVWSLEAQPPLRWRIWLRHGVQRLALAAWRGADGQIVTSEPEIKSFGLIGLPWTLTNTRFDTSLTVGLTDRSAPLDVVIARWTIWSCIDQVIEFVARHGYHETTLQNVHTELVPPANMLAYGASCGSPNGITTLTFLRPGGWAAAPSIVLHELGHALWLALYVRPPNGLDSHRFADRQQGILEGFADYFAATQLSANGEPVKIGADVLEQIGHLNAREQRDLRLDELKKVLPRVITGQPFPLPAAPGEIGPYDFGQKWANLLWDLRLQTGAQTADRIVLGAHLKPNVSGIEPAVRAEPFACYFQSLKNAAQRNQIGFTDWAALKLRHLSDLPVT